MDLFLEILDGKLKGSRTPVRNGLTIGRRGCDLNIEDPKVSSKHARLELRTDGSLWLIDLGSSNGIRVGDRKMTELALDPGISFRLGRTHFALIDASAPVQAEAPNKSSSWRSKIIAMTERGLESSAQHEQRELAAFAEPVQMVFKRGIQSGQEWTLGYGPREIGASSVDLPLYEPGLPAKCFRLTPKGRDVILRVHEDARGKIFLNGREVETAFIKAGDVLEIGNTRIEIEIK